MKPHYLTFVALYLALSPCLRAQSHSDVTVHGTIHYSGRHSGPVHIAAVDWNDIAVYDDGTEGPDLPFAAHTTIAKPGPYSLTIPHALAGHSYVVLAQMDLDSSGLFSMDSFQQYEPSGNSKGCAWGGCNASNAVPVELFESLDIDIYLSDFEPSCILLDTFEADYFAGGAADMDYHAGHLWVCDSLTEYGDGPTDVCRVDPNAGVPVASYDLGIGHCTSLEWIGDDLWGCFKGPVSWMVRQYTFDGTTFTHGATYTLPSSMDWDIVWSVNIAWDGTLLWAQEKGPCGNIYKLDLSNGSLVQTVSECDFTFNKWLGLTDMADICFSDGYLWAMNDSSATFAKISPDPNQLPPEMHYTFAFDPNAHILDRGHGADTASYRGMVKHGDLIYFVESVKVRDDNGTEIDRRHRIHTARLDQADGSRDGDNFSWARRVASNGGGIENLITGMTIDSQSNVYVTGWFDGMNDFGGVTLTSRSGGGHDIFVAKYDTTGTLQWARRAGGAANRSSEDDAGRGVGVDAVGNAYVTGQFNSTADFGDINVTAGSSRHCFFLTKYDANGVTQWVRHNACAPDRCCAGGGLAVDDVGNCYVVGSFDGAAITFGATSIAKPSGSSVNRYLVKYDGDGEVRWAIGITSTQQSMVHRVSLDKGGNIYVAGRFRSDVLIANIGLHGTSAWNSFVAKLSNSGVPLWAQVITSNSGVQAFGVHTDDQGGVYVSGGFGTVAGTTASFGSSVTLTSLGGGNPGAHEGDGIGDAFLAKYDAATGALQWARRAGGTGMDAFIDVSTDSHGNVYTAGGFMSGGDVGGLIVPANANWHVVTAKYDSNGTALGLDYAETTGGMGLAMALAVDTGGNRYLAGWYQGQATFGAIVLEPAGTWNYFLARLNGPANPDGNGLAEIVPVYRFWSPVISRHFYTADESEKQSLINDYSDVWTYEGPVYRALSNGSEPNSRPVYRFWSDALKSHFYTISESEKDFLIDTYPDVWTYETIAFYAFPEGLQPADASPVYRFWSDTLGCHFYTIDESEKDALINDSADVWTYEDVAWYAYEP